MLLPALIDGTGRSCSVGRHHGILEETRPSRRSCRRTRGRARVRALARSTLGLASLMVRACAFMGTTSS